jgi:hypothetical protein
MVRSVVSSMTESMIFVFDTTGFNACYECFLFKMQDANTIVDACSGRVELRLSQAYQVLPVATRSNAMTGRRLWTSATKRKHHSRQRWAASIVQEPRRKMCCIFVSAQFIEFSFQGIHHSFRLVLTSSGKLSVDFESDESYSDHGKPAAQCTSRKTRSSVGQKEASVIEIQSSEDEYGKLGVRNPFSAWR